jgi:hypothetical protein
MKTFIPTIMDEDTKRLRPISYWKRLLVVGQPLLV